MDSSIQQAIDRFRGRFGRLPRFAAAAPGRVNLIGEHIDYNDGFVLPMAIERRTVIVADRGPGTTATVVSSEGEAAFDVTPALRPGKPAWANYVKGVVAGCLARGMKAGGFDAVIDSTVPLGGGLSSSAALEVSTATLLEAMTGSTLDPVEKALLCQKAEHDFAGMPCGIMDQFISVMGRQGSALLLDCRSKQVRHVPMNDPAVAVLIVNSNVKHELSGTEYPQRRAQCEAAAKALGAASLRDVTMKQLVAARSTLDPLVYRRAYHVVGEIARTLQAANEIEAKQWWSVGRLMHKSHVSLRDDFEVSCPELDVLVELGQARVSKEGGVYGSRMTGGGFGGCTVSLVMAEKLDEVMRAIVEGYKARTGIEATAFATRAGEGAGCLAIANS